MANTVADALVYRCHFEASHPVKLFSCSYFSGPTCSRIMTLSSLPFIQADKQPVPWHHLVSVLSPSYSRDLRSTITASFSHTNFPNTVAQASVCWAWTLNCCISSFVCDPALVPGPLNTHPQLPLNPSGAQAPECVNQGTGCTYCSVLKVMLLFLSSAWKKATRLLLTTCAPDSELSFVTMSKEENTFKYR